MPDRPPWGLASGPLVGKPVSPVVAALGLYVGGELVRLAEEAAAPAVLRSFALVVRHEPRLVASPVGLP